MEASVILNPNTTVFFTETNNTISKKVVLTENPAVYPPGRIVSIKAIPRLTYTPPQGILTIECSTGVTIFPSLTSRTLQEYHCVTLMESPLNTYSLLNYYPGTITQADFFNPPPTSVSVPVPGDKSYLFVDLLTQSKTLVLPPISQLVSIKENVPYFMIKDVISNAATNNLYISTSGGALIDGFQKPLRLTANGSAVELFADSFLNSWQILNYFNGSITPVVSPAGSVGEIYNPITKVNVSGGAKGVMLPLAETVVGQSFLIYDSTGDCNNTNVITVILKGSDTFDNGTNLLNLETSYASVRVFARGPSEYQVLQNSKEGGTWLS